MQLKFNDYLILIAKTEMLEECFYFGIVLTSISSIYQQVIIIFYTIL